MQIPPSTPQIAASTAAAITRFIAGPPAEPASRPNQAAMTSDCCANQKAKRSLRLASGPGAVTAPAPPVCAPIARISGSISRNGALVNTASSTPNATAVATSARCARTAAQMRRSRVEVAAFGGFCGSGSPVTRESLLDLRARHDLVGPGHEAVADVVLADQLAVALVLGVEALLRRRARVHARDEPAVGALNRADRLADFGIVEQVLGDRVAVEQLRELVLAQVLLELVQRQ